MLADVRHQLSDTNGRLVHQTPGIGQVSPGLVWNARAAPEHLQSCSLAYGLHPKRFLLIFDLSDNCQTILENESRTQKILSVTLSDMMVYSLFESLRKSYSVRFSVI